MDAIDSIQKLCQRLISSAFQRCRVSEELCRLSVVLDGSRLSDPAVTRISITDTGIACSLEEFKDLKFGGGLCEMWDGMISVRTTGTCDDEISNHNLNLKDGNSANWLNSLPSILKNGMRFSGSEVCLNVLEKSEFLLDEISRFFQKMLILNIPNIGFELLIHRKDAPEPCPKNIFLPNECNPLPFPASNIERLVSGFEDYVVRQRHNLARDSGSCSSTLEHLKTGIGTANSSISGLVMEAVITISELPDQTSPPLMESGPRTEVLYFKDFVLYFKDFSPSPISKASLSGLLGIDWKSYGLAMGKILDEGSFPLLEWEYLPPCAHIDMVFHCYQEKNSYPPVKQKSYSDRTLLKKAAKLALDDLKEKHNGFLLSDHAVKIQSYAPALAKTLAGLILSSKDLEFQEECLSLLGMKPEEARDNRVEGCIKDKIISVIEQNDRKPERCKDAAPLLFEYDDPGELDFDEEHEPVDEAAFDAFTL